MSSQFKPISLQPNPPRALDSFEGKFDKGVSGYRLAGLFSLINSIVLFVFVLLSTGVFFPTVVLLAFTALGYLMLNQYKKTVAQRKNIYQHGTVVEAKVVSHGKQMSMFKSARDYRVVVQIVGSERLLDIVHTSKQLWQNMPIGSSVYGLFYEEKISVCRKFRLSVYG